MNLLTVSFLDKYFSFYTVVLVMLAGVLLGYFLKVSQIKKKEKRILELESDLLKKDAFILSLEEKIAQGGRNEVKTGSFMHKVS
jgi:Tfp pilus assembly protein PilN